MRQANDRKPRAWWRGCYRPWHPAVPGQFPVQSAERLRRHFAFPARLALLLIVAGLPWPDPARGQTDVGDGTPQAGALLLRMEQGYRVATRLDTDVSIRASGLVARTRVRQSYRNDGPDWVEGVYVFPLPAGAAVDRLKLRIGERVIEGEIRERETARKAYEQAKREGRRASLVEQERANLFTTSVANIEPGVTVIVEIEYLETVRYDEGTFSLRVPMTLTPRYIPGDPTADRQGSGWSPDTDRVPDASRITPPVVARSDGHRLTLEARIDAGVPLDLIASRYHPIRVEDDAGGYRIRLADGDVPMDHDLELLWRPVRAAAPRALAFGETLDGTPHLMLMLLPPDVAAAAPGGDARPRELVFVIDTSGSMQGVSLDQAKRALRNALDGLSGGDYFNIIQFNSVTSALYADSVAATADRVAAAKRYVDTLEADGGTEMRPALELALRAGRDSARLRQVVFITDGSVGNEAELFGLIERQLGDARLFTVGIGSAPNGWFMRKAAEAGRGTYVTISALHEVGEQISRLLRKLQSPQLTDIRMEWPDSVQADSYPETIPDLYAGEPVLVMARLARPPRPGDQLRIAGHSAAGDWGAELPLAISADAPGVAALWARSRIEALSDALRRGADAETTQKAIVATAFAHRLVTAYTSLVAVDRTPARTAEAALRREQVPNLLPHGQSMQAIFGFPATATPAPRMRMIGSLAILLATLMLLERVWNGGGRFRAAPRHA